MKICILTHDVNTSAGWGRYSDQVIRGLRARGHELSVLTEKGGEYPILRRGFGVFWSAVRVAPHFRRCDIVHALDVYPFGIIAWLATRALRRPYLVSGIGTYSVAPLKNPATAWIAKSACRGARAVMAISSYTADRIRSYVSGADVRVVHPGTDAVVRGFRSEPVPLRMLSVGALKERKGYHIAIAAFAVARKHLPSLTYTIVGDQRDRVYFSRLQKLAADLGVIDAVVFKQHLDEQQLRDEYSFAGLFVLPSVNVGDHFEGFGLVFLEAAAAGLPVIGTTGNGIADAVSPDNGILVSQRDVQSLANAVVSVLGDDARWRSMSAASIAWAQRHTVDDMIDRYEEVYRSSKMP